MKRSQIFLGVSTCILAVAAVAAAKVQKFSAAVTRYYCTSSSLNARCLPYSQVNCEANGVTTTCFYTKGVAPNQIKYALYTQGSQSPSHIYTCNDGQSCLNLVKYDGAKK